MSKDQRIILALGLVLIAALVAFFTMEGRDETRLPSPDQSDSAESTPKDLNLDLQPRRVLEEPQDPKATQAPNDLTKDYDPNYGAALYTATARAEFEVVDARQKRIPAAAKMRASLYRLVNGIKILEALNVDQKASRIVCAGAVGGGLEPGHYALSLRVGPYGALWRDFKLAPGQVLKDQIKLPTYTRVIRLRFVDENGIGIPRLSVEPSYKVKDAKLEDRSFASKPSLILRDPPRQTEDLGGIGMGGGASSGARRGRRAYLTADGAWYLQVVAGQVGHLRVGLSESTHGHEKIELDSTFTTGEWDDYLVVLKPDPQHMARLARYQPDNPEDPGNQSALHMVGVADEPRDPAEIGEAVGDWARIIFRDQADPHLVLKVEDVDNNFTFHHLGVSFIDRRGRYAAGAWFSDFHKNSKKDLKWSWNDGALLRSPTGILRQKEFAALPAVIEHVDRFERQAVTLGLGSLSPTIDAWSRGLELSWSGTGDDIDSWKRRTTPRQGDRFVVETSLARDSTGAVVAGPTLLVGLKGDARYSEKEMQLPAAPLLAALTTSQHAELDLPPRGLAFRAISPLNEGVPWAEASISKLAERGTFEQSRKALQAANIAVNWGSPFLTEDRFGFSDSRLDDEQDLKALQGLLTSELWQALGSDAARLQVARHGAWYDTRRRLRSDDRGYVVDLDLDLVPGERYLLWLWSKSRDAYEPDRVVQFVAQEGLTDLGLIELEIFQP